MRLSFCGGLALLHKLLGGRSWWRMIPFRCHVIMSSCHHVVKDSLILKQSSTQNKPSQHDPTLIVHGAKGLIKTHSNHYNMNFTVNFWRTFNFKNVQLNFKLESLGLSQKNIKLLHNRKKSSKRSEFFGFYIYFCHVVRSFYYTSFAAQRNVKYPRWQKLSYKRFSGTYYNSKS